MTNEEAISILRRWKNIGKNGMTAERLGYIEGWFHEYDAEAFDMAIKALEQESKSELEHDHEILEAYSDGANDILDKIRTNIKAMFPPLGSWMYEEGHEVEHTVCEVLSDVLEIIDKYKAESEK